MSFESRATSHELLTSKQMRVTSYEQGFFYSSEIRVSYVSSFKLRAMSNE